MIWLFSPKYAMQVARILQTVLRVLVPLMCLLSLHAIYHAPVDMAQGPIYRLIYLHVPAALISMCAAIIVGVFSSLSWVYRLHVADMLAQHTAKLGLVAALIAMLSGATWGRYTWGTWWIWDARLTSSFILAILYLVYLLAHNAAHEKRLSKRVLFVIGLLMVIDVPLIHYSVEIWNALHQTSTLLSLKQQSMPKEMYVPLMLAISTAVLLCITFSVRAFVRTYGQRVLHV